MEAQILNERLNQLQRIIDVIRRDALGDQSNFAEIIDKRLDAVESAITAMGGTVDTSETDFVAAFNTAAQ